jgi:hypothetical protein
MYFKRRFSRLGPSVDRGAKCLSATVSVWIAAVSLREFFALAVANCDRDPEIHAPRPRQQLHSA